jgi:hypothetical protein
LVGKQTAETSIVGKYLPSEKMETLRFRKIGPAWINFIGAFTSSYRSINSSLISSLCFLCSFLLLDVCHPSPDTHRIAALRLLIPFYGFVFSFLFSLFLIVKSHPSLSVFTSFYDVSRSDITSFLIFSFLNCPSFCIYRVFLKVVQKF